MESKGEKLYGEEALRKRFRNEEITRSKKDIPWTKGVLDLDKNEFFSRTPWAWFRIIGFYLFLYFCILVILLFWIFIFWLFIWPPDRPTIEKQYPGLSAVPTSSHTINIRPDIHPEVYKIADVIDKFIDGLDEDGEAEDIFADCNEDLLWGYNAKQPCIFIKLNKAIGYVAKTYDSVSELPPDHQKDLKDTMLEHPGKGRIWVTCKCLSDNVDSPDFIFIPKPYFDSTTNMQGVNRVIAVQLIDMPENEEFEFICNAWAKNIPIDNKKMGRGNIRLSLKMITQTKP